MSPQTSFRWTEVEPQPCPRSQADVVIETGADVEPSIGDRYHRLWLRFRAEHPGMRRHMDKLEREAFGIRLAAKKGRKRGGQDEEAEKPPEIL